MNPQSICELAGLLATGAALVFFLRGRRRVELAGSNRILAVVLLVSLGNYLVNFVEWSKIPTGLDLDGIEDTLDLMTPLVWWFFLYSCYQHVISRRLLETIAARQAMEKAARSSETRLRTVVESVPVYICSIDRQGKVLLANRNFRGVQADQAIGLHLRVFLPPKSDAAVERAIEEVFQTGETVTFEIVESETDAAESAAAWFSCRLAPVHEDGGIVSAIFVATDVTNLRHAQEELQHSEQRFRTLVEHAPEAIVVLDVHAGHFVDANQKAERLFGLQREALLEASWLDISPPLQPDDRASAEVLQDLVEQTLEGGSPAVAWTFRNASNDLLPCEVRLIRQPSSRGALVRGSVTLISTEGQ